MPNSNQPHHLVNIVSGRRNQFQYKLLKWAEENYRHFPWRENRTPYRILISESLLKRTTATAALRLYDVFLCTYPTIDDLANADRKKLEKTLSSLGLQRQRSRLMLEMARYLVSCGCEVPSDRESLLKIPHVGEYTVAAVLSFGYGIPAALVDSNVERILRRVFASDIPEKSSQKIIRDIANSLLPVEEHVQYNYGLLDLGALVCRYVNPKCPICPLKELCDYVIAR